MGSEKVSPAHRHRAGFTPPHHHIVFNATRTHEHTVTSTPQLPYTRGVPTHGCPAPTLLPHRQFESTEQTASFFRTSAHPSDPTGHPSTMTTQNGGSSDADMGQVCASPPLPLHPFPRTPKRTVSSERAKQTRSDPRATVQTDSIAPLLWLSAPTRPTLTSPRKSFVRSQARKGKKNKDATTAATKKKKSTRKKKKKRIFFIRNCG